MERQLDYSEFTTSQSRPSPIGSDWTIFEKAMTDAQNWSSLLSVLKPVRSLTFLLLLRRTFRSVTASLLALMSSEMRFFCSLTMAVSSCTREPDFFSLCWDWARVALSPCSSAIIWSQASFTYRSRARMWNWMWMRHLGVEWLIEWRTFWSKQYLTWHFYQSMSHLRSDRKGVGAADLKTAIF